jgi:hypothetical protein
MENKLSFARYFILYLPWIGSVLLLDYPVYAYLIAWMGSFFIFYMTLTGKIKALASDRTFAEQLMRPIILVQFIFAGYMCCTSIFYFLEILEHTDAVWDPIGTPDDDKKLALTAQCQRYYCLAHAAFVNGLLIFMRHSLSPKYRCADRNLSTLIFNISLISMSTSYLLGFAEGLSQFSHQLNTLSFIAGTLALVLAFSEKKRLRICFCLVIYGMNFYQALLSGFKEPIILSILILGIFLYPAYPKMVFFSFVPTLLVLFLLLPTYNRIFREQAWSDGLSATQAGQLAFYAALNPESHESDGAFLSYRLSEIHMFTKYVQSSPEQVEHYGFDLIQQALVSVIPRVVWPSKPQTEELVMQRVHKAGVVHPDSKVSAKPALIADAYLSGGIPGIFICLFSYGMLCQLISNKAEQLFGGYTLGIAVIFTGLFQVFWRGQCFEFLINSVCWSYLSMYLIFWMLRFLGVVTPAKVGLPP